MCASGRSGRTISINMKYCSSQLTLLTVLTSRHTHSHIGCYLFFPSLVVHLCESSRYECCYLVVYIYYLQTDRNNNFCQASATMITLASSHFINVTSLDPGFPQDGAWDQSFKTFTKYKAASSSAVGPVRGLIKTPQTNYCN